MKLPETYKARIVDILTKILIPRENISFKYDDANYVLIKGQFCVGITALIDIEHSLHIIIEAVYQEDNNLIIKI